jgi:hypothetical protein
MEGNSYAFQRTRPDRGNQMPHSPLLGYELEYTKTCTEASPALAKSGKVPHLDGRSIALHELGKALLEPTISQDARDKVWAIIVDNARRDPNSWIIIAIGLALPGLRNAVKHATVYAPHFHDRPEIESAAVAGFISAITDINTARSKICARLCNRAYVAARRCAIEITRYQRQLQSPVYESHPPRHQFGHIDLVLDKAVHEGVISQVQSTLIIDCCVEKQSVTAIAEANGLDREEARVELKEAKSRLANWLRSEHRHQTGQSSSRQ